MAYSDTTSTGPGRAPGQNWLACYYRPQRSCGQGNIFAPVCHSVHRGGVCLSACWDTTTPQSRPPWEQTPREQTPPQSRHPPGADTPLGGCGLLLWPSGMAFWFDGLLIEGGLLVWWPSD